MSGIPMAQPFVHRPGRVSSHAVLWLCALLLLAAVVIVEFEFLAGIAALYFFDALSGAALAILIGALWSVSRAMEGGGASGIACWFLLWGAVMYACGQVTVTILRFLPGGAGPTPFPSPADVFYLAGQLLFTSGLVIQVYGYLKTGLPAGSSWSYAAIYSAVLILAIVMYAGWIRPMWADASMAFSRKAMATLYDALDIVTLAAALTALRISLVLRGGAIAQGWAAIAAGFVFMTIADALFGAGFEERFASYVFFIAYSSLAYGSLRHAEVVRSVV